MGKPFNKELERINTTFQWTIKQDIDELRSELLYNNPCPLFVVGSGGSLSACYYTAILFQHYGIMAKAVTPLELFYSQNALRNSNVLFISASGKNTDILFGYKTALRLEPIKIFSICMTKDSPLSKLAKDSSISRHFDFDSPFGKDGFLATNSLVSFFTLIFKIFNPIVIQNQLSIIKNDYYDDLLRFINKISDNYTFHVLYAGLGYPVAIDIESKLVEAALGDVIISDYRNFGHGRHHWFAKRKANSAVIAIITPEEEKIAQKTLSLLPPDIPTLILDSKDSSHFSCINLLVKSFHFINELGKLQNIDPGRPGVPIFGSKLYNLRYSSFYKDYKELSDLERIAILRKTKVPSTNSLRDNERVFWRNAYNTYKNKLNNTEFGSIVFDYDGTLCSSSSRYAGIDNNIIRELVKLLERGLVIGIATGRGQSVKKDLHEKLPNIYHSKVIVGYYNCAIIGELNNLSVLIKDHSDNEHLNDIFELIRIYPFTEIINPELKPNQITVEVKDKKNWNKVRATIIDLVQSKDYPGIQILESTHSIDIIDQNTTSKLNILSYCTKVAVSDFKAENCLCIGDKGQWPGNDYQLLSSPYSLSVDEVSNLNEVCWNLAPPGVKNIEATLYYLSFLSFNSNGAKLNIP